MSGSVIAFAPKRAAEAADKRAERIDTLVGAVISAIQKMRESGATTRDEANDEE
jgi:hypothetical protein